MNRQWWQRLRLRTSSDRGGLELFFAGMALIGFLAIGLVVDVGGGLNATSKADYLAQEAARAGAQQINPGEAITGEAIIVDPDAARSAATSYLSNSGLTGDVAVSADGQTLTVVVQDTYHPYFASLLGKSSIAVTGHGKATLIHQAGD